MANFVAALEGQAQPPSTPDQGIKLMKIIDAMYHSAQTHAPVDVAGT